MTLAVGGSLNTNTITVSRSGSTLTGSIHAVYVQSQGFLSGEGTFIIFCRLITLADSSGSDLAKQIQTVLNSDVTSVFLYILARNNGADKTASLQADLRLCCLHVTKLDFS